MRSLPGSAALASIPFAVLISGILPGASVVEAAVLEVPTPEFPNIQTAIGLAQDGDTVLLADGTFTGPGNVGLNFLGKNLTLRATNDFLSTIDGGGASPGLAIVQGETDAHVIGVKFTRCVNANGDPGGALRVAGAHARIESCFFLGNLGTGALAVDGGSVEVIDAIFRDNVSTEGGAVYLLDSDYVDWSSTYSTNRAERGGAIYSRFSRVQSTGSGIFVNEATEDYGGGIYLYGVPASATFEGLFTLQNQAAVAGGGIYSHFTDFEVYRSNLDGDRAPQGGAFGFEEADVRVAGCAFFNLSADEGAGVWMRDAALDLWYSEFVANSATVRGGAVAVDTGQLSIIGGFIRGNYSAGRGGGIDIQGASSLSARYLFLTGNKAETSGGGIYTVGSTDPFLPIFADVVRSTVAGNRATVGSGGGFSLNGFGEFGFTQSVLWRNCAGFEGDQVAVAGDSSVFGTFCSSIDSSGVEASTESILSYGGLESFVDPLFCAPGNCISTPDFHGDYRYEPGSECLPANGACGEVIGVRDATCGMTTPSGSCCLDGGFCIVAPSLICEELGGDYLGDNTNCSTTGCETSGVEDPVVATSTRGSLRASSPAQSQSTIIFSLEGAESVSVAIFDSSGRRVRSLEPAQLGAGRHEMSWNLADDRGRAVPAGVYFVRASLLSGEADGVPSDRAPGAARVVVVR